MTLTPKIDTINIRNNAIETACFETETKMAEILDKNNKEEMTEEEESIVVTLTDLEDGSEKEFELIGEGELNGVRYFALAPLENEDGEYYIFRGIEEENGDMTFETIEDDKEFEAVEDYFNDLLFSDFDYDQQ